VPWRKGEYWYYTRYDPGQNHPVLAGAAATSTRARRS
jgi:protease II